MSVPSPVDFIKNFEGCYLKAYADVASDRAVNKRKTGIDDPTLNGDPWTIGYGHTGADVKEGLKITQHQAEVLFDYDLDKYKEGVKKMTKGMTLTEGQNTALVSFAFNCGITALANSTLMKKFKAGDIQGAADQFDRWVNANGHVMPGLVRRRAAEKALFLTP